MTKSKKSGSKTTKGEFIIEEFNVKINKSLANFIVDNADELERVKRGLINTIIDSYDSMSKAYGIISPLGSVMDSIIEKILSKCSDIQIGQKFNMNPVLKCINDEVINNIKQTLSNTITSSFNQLEKYTDDVRNKFLFYKLDTEYKDKPYEEIQIPKNIPNEIISDFDKKLKNEDYRKIIYATLQKYETDVMNHNDLSNIINSYNKNRTRLNNLEKAIKDNVIDLSIKSKFMKQLDYKFTIGEGFYQTIMNKFRQSLYPKVRPLLDGEYHLPKHNFTGPGTRIDLAYVRNYEPFNDIDACSKTHDLDYYTASNISDPIKKAKLIRDADLKVLGCYDKFKDEDGYRPAKLGIESKMKLENFAPDVMKNLTGNYFGNGYQY